MRVVLENGTKGAEQMESSCSAEPEEEVLSLLEVCSAVVCNQHLG